MNRRKSNDPLGQWKEFLAGGRKDAPRDQGAAGSQGQEKAGPGAPGGPSDRQEEDEAGAPPEQPEDQAEAAGETAQGEEAAAETSAGQEEPDGREDGEEGEEGEPGGSETPPAVGPASGPISKWEQSLVDATKEDDDEEDVSGEEEEEDEEQPAEEEMVESEVEEEPPMPAPDKKTEWPRKSAPEGGRQSSFGERSAPMPQQEVKQKPEGDAGDLQRHFGLLESAFGELAKLRGDKAEAVLSSLSKTAQVFEAQHRRVMDLLRDNETQSREAKSVIGSVEKRQEIKKDLEAQISDLKAVNEQLASMGDRLETERASLDAEKNKASTENSRLKTEAGSLTEEIERMTAERESLEKETVELEKERDHLEEDVRRLTRLKEEYLANIARFRDEG